MYTAILGLLVHLHPLHVSVGTINYSEKDQALQITIKIFADDLEDELNETMRNESEVAYIDILNPADPEILNNYLEQYIRNNFSVKLNGKTMRMSYLGHEQEDMVIWCYLEIKGVKKLEEIEVQNTIMTSRFDDQVNLIHVSYQDQIKSFRLSEDKPSDKVAF